MIEIVGLGKDFGEYCALSALDLTVGAGEIFGFLGPNGAGKTTTIKMITGLLAPSRGQVSIAGHDVAEAPEKTKRMTGYIPDSPFLYDKLTGDEYLAFVAGLWDVPREQALAAAAPYLEQFKIADVRHELIERYSHGMKQKLVMTAAFIHEPALLVVDEPTVGLDPRSVLTMKKLFRQHAEAGGTVFLSTHSLDVAETVCDRIGILHQGRLVTVGTMEELRDGNLAGEDSLEHIFLILTEEGQ